MQASYFIYRWMARQPCSVVQNLVVNCHLMGSYSQQSHIGINVNHWYVIIVAVHIMLPFAFSRAERFNNFYNLLVVIFIKNKQIILKKKRISKTMSKRQSIFTKNFTISFSNAGKTVKLEAWRNLNLSSSKF